MSEIVKKVICEHIWKETISDKAGNSVQFKCINCFLIYDINKRKK